LMTASNVDLGSVIFYPLDKILMGGPSWL
jgi:hypothetical protein